MDIEDILDFEVTEFDWQEQSRQLEKRCKKLKTALNISYEEIADLIHENRTLKNNLDAYIKRLSDEHRN